MTNLVVEGGKLAERRLARAEEIASGKTLPVASPEEILYFARMTIKAVEWHRKLLDKLDEGSPMTVSERS